MSQTTTDPDQLVFAEAFDGGAEIDTYADGTITIDLSMLGGVANLDIDEATEYLLTLAAAIRAARELTQE